MDFQNLKKGKAKWHKNYVLELSVSKSVKWLFIFNLATYNMQLFCDNSEAGKFCRKQLHCKCGKVHFVFGRDPVTFKKELQQTLKYSNT